MVFLTGLKTTAAASFLGLRLSLPSSWLLQLSVSCGAAVNGRNVSPLFSRVETHYDQLSSLEFKAQFSEGTVVKNLPANAEGAGDVDSIPGLGRSPQGGNGNPLQYSCLEKSHGQRSLVDYTPWGHFTTPWMGLYLPLSATYLTHNQKMTKNPGILCHNPVALLLNLGSGNIMKPLDPSDFTIFFRGKLCQVILNVSRIN